MEWKSLDVRRMERLERHKGSMVWRSMRFRMEEGRLRMERFREGSAGFEVDWGGLLRGRSGRGRDSRVGEIGI